MKKKTIVISLGGSLVVPNLPDVKFLKSFRKLILKNLSKYRFVLVIGGGKTCRNYQAAAKQIVKMSNVDLDWLGIHVTWLNASLVRFVFKDVAHKDIVNNPNKKIIFDKVLVAGGWQPGCSTDNDAVMLAKTFGADTLINMTNVSNLYDKDPSKYKNAKKIFRIDWKGLQKIVGVKWNPGMNVPFDPIATKKASKMGLRLVLLGNDLKNLENYLNNKKFKGSVVEG